MNIAIIPARGGSKRIPRKNIKLFNGKPIIAYSIEAAKHAGCFDRIIVSTDDHEIADIARQYGAEVPFMRPAELADDFATTGTVMQHSIEMLQASDVKIDYVCCIYATAPFIREEYLQACLTKLKQTPSADYCFPVCEFPFPIQRGVRLSSQQRVEMYHPEHFATRSQDLEAAFHDIGQFYWGKPTAFKHKVPMFSKQAIGHPIPRRYVVDLDTQEDWDFALLLADALKDSLPC